jgi:hypothetical protein
MFLLLTCLTTQAQSIRGVNGTLEETRFIVTIDETDKNTRLISFIGLCENCPEKLTLAATAEISSKNRKSIESSSLRLNSTYSAGLIGYYKDTNIAYRIILDQGY